MEDVPLESKDGCFDLVLGSFGMGSFVEDLNKFIISIVQQLERDGVCILSFYNQEALRYITPPPWRDSSLSAELLRNRDELEVTLPTGEQFKIFCRAYEVVDLQSRLEQVFDDVKISSSSALASFLPSQLFSVGIAAAKAKEIIKKMDYELEESGLMNGAYFKAV